MAVILAQFFSETTFFFHYTKSGELYKKNLEELATQTLS